MAGTSIRRRSEHVQGSATPFVYGFVYGNALSPIPDAQDESHVTLIIALTRRSYTEFLAAVIGFACLAGVGFCFFAAPNITLDRAPFDIDRFDSAKFDSAKSMDHTDPMEKLLILLERQTQADPYVLEPIARFIDDGLILYTTSGGCSQYFDHSTPDDDDHW